MAKEHPNIINLDDYDDFLIYSEYDDFDDGKYKYTYLRGKLINDNKFVNLKLIKKTKINYDLV